MWKAAKEMSPSGIETLKKLNVDTVYLNTGWDETYNEFYLKKHPFKYVIFLDCANQTGVDVQALLGESTWTLTKYYKDLESQVKTILDFNKEYKYRFTAVHLDIEPHLVKGWNDNVEYYLSSYLENIQKIKKLIDNHNLDEDDNLTLSLDIPFWYYQDEYNVKGFNIVDLLLQVVDEINVMVYTTNQKDFVEWGQGILKIADNYPDKIIKIACELQPDIDVSLYNMNTDEITNYLDKSITKFEKHESFSGLALHDYSSLFIYIDKIDKGILR
jgi:hypothetical protein